MSTPARTAANRTNAMKSTGPRSAAGKQKIAVNALRHGLTGRTVLLPSDDLDLYRSHVKSLTASLKPEGPEEIQLASLIADDYWRLQRLKSVEDGIFALQYAENESLSDHPQANAALHQARAFLEHAARLERLALYEQRIHRAIRNSAARLEQLQAARRAAAPQARPAAQSSQPARPEPSPQRPPQRDTPADGFEFSSAPQTGPAAGLERPPRTNAAGLERPPRTNAAGLERPPRTNAA